MHEVLLRTSDGNRRLTIDDSLCKSLGVTDKRNLGVVSLFLASWITLLSDSPLEPHKKPFRLYRAFLNGLARDGLKATVLRYSGLSHTLVSQHRIMGQSTLIGDWIDDFKDTPVFFEYNRYFKTGDPAILRFLYTFLNFGKKLEYVDDSFEEVAFRDWQDCEKRLSDLSLVDDDCDALRIILESCLPRFQVNDFAPKFGPGRVQERGIEGRISKIRNFEYDSYIDRFLFHGHIGMYGMGEDHGLSAEKVIPNLDGWAPGRRECSRVARLRFVPKNLKTARSICMEPNVLMFFQQGVMREFLQHIDKSCFSRFIRIRDQARNRDLALFGSYTGEVDTLDLSAASDSVSMALVKAVFPPSWQIPMRATRSHSCITPDGGLHRLMKFAPMGSALCFPTQCMIFVSICIYAACLYTYEVEHGDGDFLCWLKANLERVLDSIPDKPHSWSARFQPIAVYGDDICVDRRLTPIVRTILARLGFVMNDSKSFMGSQAFRESCGGFYLDGNDITPLYFRIGGVRERLTPEHVASQVQLINAARERGYKNLYRFLHRTLMTWEPPRRFRNTASTRNPIPYVSDPSQFGILVTKPANSHLQTRENSDYQRTEGRAWTIAVVDRIQPNELLSKVDAYEHMRWWSSHSGGTPLSDFVSPVPRYDAAGNGFRWRWTPLE